MLAATGELRDMTKFLIACRRVERSSRPGNARACRNTTDKKKRDSRVMRQLNAIALVSTLLVARPALAADGPHD